MQTALNKFESWRESLRRYAGRNAGAHLRQARLPVLKTAVAHGVAEAETLIVGVCESLEPLADQSKKLLERTEELIVLAGGRGHVSDYFGKIVEDLREPLTFAEHCVSQHQQRLALLHDVSKLTSELFVHEESMHKILAPLRHMIVFFKIESAGLPPDDEAAFAAVAREIQRLASLIEKSFTSHVDLLRNVSVVLNEQIARCERDAIAQLSFIEQKRKNIDKALESLVRLSQNLSPDQQIRRSSKILNYQISGLISAIQQQDILSQKCAHITSAIDDAMGHGRFSAWAHLLARQVEEAFAQFKTVGNNMRAQADAVVGAANELSAAADSLGDLECMTAGADGMVQLLLDTFEDITDLVTKTGTIFDEALAIIDPISLITRDVSNTIEEISIQITVIALNAQVRSIQLGTGTGLEVLSAHTADISQRLTSVGTETRAKMDELRLANDKLSGLLTSVKERGNTQIAQLAERKPKAEQSLHDLRNRTLMAKQDIGESLNKILECAGNLSNSGGCIAKIPEAIHVAVGALVEGIERPISIDAKTAEALSVHARRYTTTEERQVHAQTVKRAGAESSAAQTPVLAGSEPAEAGSIELF